MTGDEIRKTRFREALRGYHPRDVDRFLEEIAQALDNGTSATALFADVTFRDKLRGYRREDVDQLLDRIRRAV